MTRVRFLRRRSRRVQRIRLHTELAKRHAAMVQATTWHERASGDGCGPVWPLARRPSAPPVRGRRTSGR